MGQISLGIPQSGQTFATEGAKVATDMTTIQNVINGNLDTNNLSASAAITFSQLATGATLGMPSSVGVTANGTLAASTLTEVNTNVTTQTLPTPTTGRLVGVLLGTAASVTVTTSGAPRIIGVGAFTVTSIQMGVAGQVVLFYGDGTNWVIVSGQQDTGWLAPSSVNAGVVQTVALKCRLVGDTVELSGTATWASLSGGVILTLPAGFPAPTSAKDWICVTGSDTHAKMAASSTNLTNTNSTGQAFLDVIRYRVGS